MREGTCSLRSFQVHRETTIWRGDNDEDDVQDDDNDRDDDWGRVIKTEKGVSPFRAARRLLLPQASKAAYRVDATPIGIALDVFVRELARMRGIPCEMRGFDLACQCVLRE